MNVRRATLWTFGLCLFVAAAACHKRPAEPTRAFYYWRTTFALSNHEREVLQGQRIERLYLRLFDVGWDKTAGVALPLGRIEFIQPLPAGIAVTPVVYLTNTVFENEPHPAELAAKVWKEVLASSAKAGFSLSELQVDCDWTDRTREAFFAFCEKLRGLARAAAVRLSATVRLHQIKYQGRTGIPPVDRGMLMFYNMGQVEAQPARMSIFNAADAERYVAFIDRYPLPLDRALAVFSWAIHGRDGRVVGLIDKADAATLAAVPALRRTTEQSFVAEQPSFFRGTYLQEGDTLVLESMGPALARQAAELLGRHFHPRQANTIALFDLDERNLRGYSAADLQSLFSARF